MNDTTQAPFVDFDQVWLAYNDDLLAKNIFAVEDINLQASPYAITESITLKSWKFGRTSETSPVTILPPVVPALTKAFTASSWKWPMK